MDADTDSWFERRDIVRYAFETKPTRLISFYQRLSAPLLSEGVLVLNVYVDEIGDMFNEVSSATEMDFFLMDQDGNILFANDWVGAYSQEELAALASQPEGTWSQSLIGQEVMVNRQPSEKWPEWSYVSILSRKTLYQFPVTVWKATWLLIAVCLVVGAMLAYRATRRNIGYLEDILHIIESSENGAVPDSGIRQSDVYGFILTNIVRTYAGNQTLITQLSEKNYQIQSLEFMALRNQIRPHFLYNTLETIKWMSIGLTKGPNVASDMLQHLSGILHYTFSHTLESVEIAAETEMVNHYFAIQKARFKHFSGVAWAVDESLKSAKILKFMMQPIVENCFQHGLGAGPETRSLRIKLSIRRKSDKMLIKVTDTGLGMERAAAKALRAKLAGSGYQKGEEHIGLTNTHNRIRLYYGEEYGLSIASRPNFGTVVCLTLPILFDTNEASPPKPWDGTESAATK